MKRILWLGVVLSVGLTAFLAGWIRHVPDGHVGVVRGGGTVRHLPPGVHLVNPFLERMDRIPTSEFPVRGIASVSTVDGFTVRLPFTASVRLSPGDFEAALGDRGGLTPAQSVVRGLEAGLSTWGSTHTAEEFLRGDLTGPARAAVGGATKPLGIHVEAFHLQRPDPDIYLFLAEDALSREDPARGAELIASALAESPDDPRLRTARGMLREAAGDWPGAEADYLGALARDAGAEKALGRMFLALQEQDELLRLERLLFDGLAARPDSLRIRNWLALTYVALERFADALDHLKRARQQAPRDAATLTNLGGVYQKIGRPEEAAQAYQEALDGNPGDASLLFNLGLAELARGDLLAARTALERARDAGTRSVRLHNVLAEAYRRSGMKDKATRELLASYRLDPDQPDLRGTLTRLLGHPPD